MWGPSRACLASLPPHVFCFQGGSGCFCSQALNSLWPVGRQKTGRNVRVIFLFYSWPGGGGLSGPLWGGRAVLCCSLTGEGGAVRDRRTERKPASETCGLNHCFLSPGHLSWECAHQKARGVHLLQVSLKKAARYIGAATRQAGICNSITCEQGDQWHNCVLCLHFLLSLPSHPLSSLGSQWKAHIEIWDCSLSQQISKEGCRILPRRKHKIHLRTS